MDAPRILVCVVGALALFAAAPGFALEPMKVQETAANLANLKMLLAAREDVTFMSDVPTNPEGTETADVLTAFGVTKRGESALIPSPTANIQKLDPVKEIAFYEDAGLTQFSDLVVLYEDNRFQQGFGFFSATPEPADWALILAGVGAVGAVLRRTRVGHLPGDARTA